MKHTIFTLLALGSFPHNLFSMDNQTSEASNHQTVQALVRTTSERAHSQSGKNWQLRPVADTVSVENIVVWEKDEVKVKRERSKSFIDRTQKGNLSRLITACSSEELLSAEPSTDSEKDSSSSSSSSTDSPVIVKGRRNTVAQ